MYRSGDTERPIALQSTCRNEGSSLARWVFVSVGTRQAFLKSNQINLDIHRVALMELVGCRDIKAKLREDDSINSPLLRLLHHVLCKEGSSTRQREENKRNMHVINNRRIPSTIKLFRKKKTGTC